MRLERRHRHQNDRTTSGGGQGYEERETEQKYDSFPSVYGAVMRRVEVRSRGSEGNGVDASSELIKIVTDWVPSARA